MIWSANSISAPLQRLAQKTAAGSFAFGSGQVIPPAAATQTVNPTASQRTDAVAPTLSEGGPLAPAAPANPLATRTKAQMASGGSMLKDLEPAEKTAAQQLKEKVIGPTDQLGDAKLGSRAASTAPGAVNLIQASTFKSPYAPEFLTQAVQGLNETDAYTSMMHQGWRETLLNALANDGDSAALTPALAAASVAPGAKFSWMGGGAGAGAGAATARTPSYWEQKLAFNDMQAARQRMDWSSQKSNQLGVGLNTFMSPSEVAGEQSRYKDDYLEAQQRSNLAAKVLGVTPVGKTAQGYASANRWNSGKSTPNGWW